MNNKTIIEFGFRKIWRIMEISEGVIRRGSTTHSSISIIPHKILILIHQLLNILSVLQSIMYVRLSWKTLFAIGQR